MTGTITKIIKKDANRKTDMGGYFFIKDDEGHDRFAHAHDLQGAKFDTLKDGLRVEFQPLAGAKSRKGGGNGLRAEAVRVIA